MDRKSREKAYCWQQNNLLLNLQVQPKANKNSFAGEHNNRLKVTTTAPPSSGKANDHLIKYLAKHFGVPQKQVTIIKGRQSRHKSVIIVDPQKNLAGFRACLKQ